MKYKKRNPFIGEKHLNRPHDIAYSLKIAKSIFGSDNIKFLYLGGKGEETYLVTLKDNKILDFPIDLTLKKGKYVVKFAYEIFSKSEIEGLKIFCELFARYILDDYKNKHSRLRYYYDNFNVIKNILANDCVA